jgi:hypothetical protein
MAIIGISGRAQSGKDSVGRFIRILDDIHYPAISTITNHHWETRKFADKLKDIVCILIGCTREDLENEEFKEKELGEEWCKYKVIYRTFDRLSHNPYGEWFTEFYSSLEDAEKCTKGNLELDESSKSIELIKMTPRKLLQLLGTECGRQIIHPDIWVNALMSEYTSPLMLKFRRNGIKPTPKAIQESYPNWIITDVRFPNEAKAIKDRGGIMIRVNRNNSMPNSFQLKNRDHSIVNATIHESETALDNYEFDYVINNTGTEEKLKEKVKEILIKEKIL